MWNSVRYYDTLSVCMMMSILDGWAYITTQQAMVPFLSDYYTRKHISEWGTSGDPEDKGKYSESKAVRYLPKISLIAFC